MAKKKQNQSPISIDVVRWGITGALAVAAISISFLAMSSYIRRSGLFIVKQVVIDEKAGRIDVPDLDKLRGKNIFDVDLEKIQAKIALKYPQIARLEVLRRFPDEISVSGERRKAVAAVFAEGRSVAVSRDGYYIGSPVKEDGVLVLVRGLQKQKPLPGIKVDDARLTIVFQALDQVQKEPALAAFHLRSMDISDIDKIVFSFGLPEDAARFDVVVDKNNCVEKIKIFSIMVNRNDLAINEIKYIDLRFNSAVIGKKKVKK